MTDAIRLSKRLADQLGCSRREAELYIEGGWVRVDGQIIEAPFHKVAPAQQVELLVHALGDGAQAERVGELQDAADDAVLLAAPGSTELAISQLYGGGGNVGLIARVELFDRGEADARLTLATVWLERDASATG